MAVKLRSPLFLVLGWHTWRHHDTPRTLHLPRTQTRVLGKHWLKMPKTSCFTILGGQCSEDFENYYIYEDTQVLGSISNSQGCVCVRLSIAGEGRRRRRRRRRRRKEKDDDDDDDDDDDGERGGHSFTPTDFIPFSCISDSRLPVTAPWWSFSPSYPPKHEDLSLPFSSWLSNTLGSWLTASISNDRFPVAAPWWANCCRCSSLSWTLSQSIE